ncbi:MAG TPA: arginase [Gammaproteobacteria bacterium]|nr:arginase [Gammaproteobacteria bacterium]
MTKKNIHLLGYASALGGVNPECGQGPLLLQQSKELNQLWKELAEKGRASQWDKIFQPLPFPPEKKADEIKRLCQNLALRTAELTQKEELFIVFGGDHTSAIGTWSGVHHVLQQPLGLIWVDAHMDSHTPETSETGRFHGMSLAALLGYGDSRFTDLLSSTLKINPEQLCLIGVRSYEGGEIKLLQKLGVRIFFMDEVKKRGLPIIFKEALALANRGTAGFGLSVDVDSLDPREAPGVDVPEPEGLSVKDLSEVLQGIAEHPRLKGIEVVEFNPHRDIEQLTEKAIVTLVQAMLGP